MFLDVAGDGRWSGWSGLNFDPGEAHTWHCRLPEWPASSDCPSLPLCRMSDFLFHMVHLLFRRDACLLLPLGSAFLPFPWLGTFFPLLFCIYLWVFGNWKCTASMPGWLSWLSCPNILIHPRQGSLEPLNYSLLVRSPGDKLGLHLVSEIGGGVHGAVL